MKVLLINTSDIIGGAAVAANRLLHALNDSGIEAKMLVKFKSSDDKRVVSIGDSFLSSFFKWLRFISERLLIFVANQFSKKNLFAVSIANTGFDISVFDAVKDADVIHIHWINQGFLSLSDINKISGLGKPIIWTMHDMWPFTSVCHYAGDCNEYHNKCIKCNM
ncbi:MAG: glycosyltransferase, partial [Bacteroidales bacterium]|nr:glycosyltransferase [Bacteroidales bacterium]